MERKIYKYALEVNESQVLMIPDEAEILSVQMQDGSPKLWALLDTAAAGLSERKILIFGTGNIIPEGNFKFISTFQMREGRLVFHVFEKI